MKKKDIATEQELNDRLAELQTRKHASRLKRTQRRFRGDVCLLAYAAISAILWITSAQWISDEQVAVGVTNVVITTWQLLPIIMIVGALKRVIDYKSSQLPEEG